MQLHGLYRCMYDHNQLHDSIVTSTQVDQDVDPAKALARRGDGGDRDQIALFHERQVFEFDHGSALGGSVTIWDVSGVADERFDRTGTTP